MSSAALGFAGAQRNTVFKAFNLHNAAALTSRDTDATWSCGSTLLNAVCVEVYLRAGGSSFPLIIRSTLPTDFAIDSVYSRR